MIEVLFWSIMGTMLGFLLCQLGKLWGDFVAPAIRDWRYERHMEKARQEFLRELERHYKK